MFPLRVETGRYKGTNRNERFFQVCDEGFIEDEMHFLYGCSKLKDKRDPFMYTMLELLDGWNVMSKLYRTKMLLSADFLKLFAEWLEKMYYARREILYR